MRRRIVATLVAILTLAPISAVADTLEPVQWPTELRLGSAPNAIRFGGTDRYQTSLAMSLALRGSGEFPYDTPDRTSGAAPSLAAAHGWWGLSSCPSSVIVVAGDTPADALAAASLSDPTNRSDEPRLQRVAAADPFFDPAGGFDRVDTGSAPIVVTASGRSGATSLSPPARVALSDLSNGGCTTAREAIIVGGQAAVPVEVEAELVSLGYEEVFRVAGVDRFDTAARIATALGTEPVPAGATCVDPRTDDGSAAMGFYGNAVIEYRPDAETCQLHGRTVVLADGDTGADALAAGWWTSYWQVPVLLVRGDGSLPPATRSALQTLDIETIVVLGGTGRVPESVVEDATRLAGAVAGRFAGRDRYETSVTMAVVFGGWYPTGDPDDFEGDRVCVAASSGTIGWPDALSAGPWCGRLAANAATVTSPTRAFEPVEAANGPVEPPRSAHDAAPVLLVPSGAAAPSPAVSDLLAGAFPAGGEWCDGRSDLSCRMPGFAVSFGGTSTISDALLDRVSSALAGGDEAQIGAAATLEEPFRTGLDLSPVFATTGAVGGPKGCTGGGAIGGARWLAVYADPLLVTFRQAIDLVADSSYRFSLSRPSCIALNPADESPTIVAISAAGRPSNATALPGGESRTLSMSDDMRHGGPLATEGDPGTADTESSTTWQFRDAPSSSLVVRRGTEELGVAAASVDLTLVRGRSGSPVEFTAQLTIDLGLETIVGTADGQAVRLGARWELAGRFVIPGAAGGFRATLATNDTEENSDDLLTWRVDATSP